MINQEDLMREAAENKVSSSEAAFPKERCRTDDGLLLAKADLAVEEIGRYIDLDGYVHIARMPMGFGMDCLIGDLCKNRILAEQEDGLFAVTVMGALMFCRSLDDYPDLARRSLRLTRYSGTTSSVIARDMVEKRGYAVAFAEIVRMVDLILPSEEVFVGGIRRLKRHYSDVAIRELLANAMVHQDLSVSGKNVAVEIFDDRVEISNIGAMPVDAYKILGAEPVPRNEAMASLMGKLGLCGGSGHGWGRVVESCEEHHLPVPTIEQSGYGTRVIMRGYAPFADMTVEERVWNCYMHACIMFVNRKQLTNSTLRARFGLESTSSNMVMVSRVIKAAVGEGLIKPMNEDAAPRNMRYVPFWA